MTLLRRMPPSSQVIGALQYLSHTRPGVSYAVSKLAQFMHCPSETHWIAAKRGLWHLESTSHHGLFLKRNQGLCLMAFTNADWAGNLDDWTSTAVYVVYIGGNAISWFSMKQKIDARSSTEAKYRAFYCWVNFMFCFLLSLPFFVIILAWWIYQLEFHYKNEAPLALGSFGFFIGMP